MARTSRRRLMVASAAVGALALGGALAAWLLYPHAAAWAVRARVIPAVEQRLARTITAGGVMVERGKAVLRDLTVRGARDQDEPLAHIARVEIDFDAWDALRGDLRLHRVVITGVRGEVVRHDDGTDNISDLVRALGGGGASGEDEPAAERTRSLRPEVVVIEDAALVLRDRAAGITIEVGELDATVPGTGQVEATLGQLAVSTAFGPAARAERVVVAADLHDPLGTARVAVQGGEIAAHRSMALSSVSGSVDVAEPRGRLRIDLRGSYGGATEPLWQARGWVEPRAGKASVHIGAERFTFDRIDSILRGSALIDYDQTAVGAALDIDMAEGRIAFAGNVELSGANIYHPMLADAPVRDIQVRGAVQGALDLATRTLTVAEAQVTSRGVEYRVDGFISMPGGVEPETERRREHARLQARLVIPPVPCQTMLEGLPEALRPHLTEYKLGGRFRTDLVLAIDWADLEATVLDGGVGIFGCKVLKEPEGEHGLARLERSFTHMVDVEVDRRLELVIGPENPDFVPLEEISPHLLSSLMTTEDARYYDHRGFIVREFRTALIRNLDAGYFRYGASSITMQTVKNVLLYRDKTLARKLQELFLTWYIETRLSKDRILEIYVNAIEYGPGIYGIGRAARHYFGKHPRDLSPVEAAFFSSILPAPKPRYKQYCENRLTRWTEGKMQRILKLMHRRGLLTNEQYEEAEGTPLVFDRREAVSEKECKALIKRAIEGGRPTEPRKR